MNERLEEIENKLLQATNEDDEDVVYASICAEAVLEDLQWTVGYAKKQAERVAELETDSSAFHTLEILYMDSEQQNKRYREAIEYVINAKVNQYASVENIINDIKFVLSEALESEPHD